MNTVDIILTVMIAAVLILAVAGAIRNRRRGKCSCGCCSGCDLCKGRENAAKDT